MKLRSRFKQTKIREQSLLNLMNEFELGLALLYRERWTRNFERWTPLRFEQSSRYFAMTRVFWNKALGMNKARFGMRDWGRKICDLDKVGLIFLIEFVDVFMFNFACVCILCLDCVCFMSLWLKSEGGKWKLDKGKMNYWLRGGGMGVREGNEIRLGIFLKYIKFYISHFQGWCPNST